MAARSKTHKDPKSALAKVAKERQKIWFQNLIALGFPVRAVQEEFKLTFHDGMFDKPNKAGFEHVFHFLFCKLDKEKAEELFRYRYPPRDKKACQEFRTACMGWWKKIAEENPLFNLPRVSNTLLMSPNGQEFYKVLFSFTTFVIYSEARRLSAKGEDDALLPSIPSKSKCIGKAQIIAMKSHCHSEVVELTQNLQIDKHIDVKMHRQAESMLQQYREDIKRIKALEHQKNELMAKLKVSVPRTPGTPSRMHTQTLEKTLSARTNETLGSVRAMWDTLLSAVMSTEDEREIICSILSANKADSGLDAAKLAPKVPSALLQQCTNEVYQNVGTSLYQGGQLNLVSLMKLFNLSLHLLIEKLHEVGVPNFENQIPYVAAQSHIHEKNVVTLNRIREKLHRLTPETEKINIELKKRVDELYAKREETQSTLISGLPKPKFESTKVLDQNDNNIGLLPISPPLNFSDNTNSSTLKTPDLSKRIVEADLLDIAVAESFPMPPQYLQFFMQSSPVSQNSTLSEDIAQFSSKPVQPSPASKNNTLLEDPTQYSPKPATQSLKQGSLEFGPGASPKTSRKRVGMKEALLHRRTMKQLPASEAKGVVKPPKKTVQDTPKASSVPSTPVARTSDTRIERVKSRTPEAVRNLISQVADYTMLEMSVLPGNKPSETTPATTNENPAFFDISSQLDITVFESRDKLDRTPPASILCDSLPLMPEPLMKENVDPNTSVSLKSSASVTQDSLDSSTSSFVSDSAEPEVPEPACGSSMIATPLVPTHTTSSAMFNDFPGASQPITPYKLGLTAFDDMDFSNCPDLMDILPPATPECFRESFDASELPSVPIGNLIDL